MKKMFLAAVAAFFCFSFANAQFADLPFKLGVKAGFNASSVTGMGDVVLTDWLGTEAPLDTKYKPGFQLGIVAQYDFTPDFFLQPELLFSNQGVKAEWKENYGNYTRTETGTLHLNYLQLPVYVGYKINAGTDLDVLLGVGPYISYGIYGSNDFFDAMKRFDFGGATMVGVQFEKFQITAGFDFGFIDMRDTDTSFLEDLGIKIDKYHNRNAKVSVAYFF